MDQIRSLTEEDMAEADALIKFSFQRADRGGAPLVRASPEMIWGYYSGGVLASTVIVLPHKVFIHGKVHGLGVIVGVASWPEFRRGGKIGQLLVHSLTVMRSLGHTLSYLVPFSYPFYRRYGWELTHEYKTYTLKNTQVPGWVGQGRIQRVTHPDIGLLNALYRQYAMKFNGMLERDEYHWKNRVLERKQGQIVIYYNSENEPTGYMIYENIANKFTVKEIVYLDEDAQKGLWEHIRKHEGMYQTVTFPAPTDDPFPFLMENPKRMEVLQTPHLMTRVVDAEALLLRYPFRPTASRKITVTVTDPDAPWNDGTFRIETDSQDKGKVEKVVGTGVTEGISCDIQTFTALIMGYKDARFLHSIGRLQGAPEDVEQWQAAIPLRTNYYIDFGY